MAALVVSVSLSSSASLDFDDNMNVLRMEKDQWKMLDELLRAPNARNVPCLVTTPPTLPFSTSTTTTNSNSKNNINKKH